ncbi:hypothetical protein EGR_00353 [Echinococcus granulosus]|uniref:Uncharacterized protein n=1 Tax=Echinococcus granulosus TaxID=6210 RepID=W6VE41_ECHGR|nr:hypothetical protein EGR_00353 [Echinococcus granulosus]EUB65084.1 hypothetical protein EGR_00353 [Echinococcus granulosus]
MSKPNQVGCFRSIGTREEEIYEPPPTVDIKGTLENSKTAGLVWLPEVEVIFGPSAKGSSPISLLQCMHFFHPSKVYHPAVEIGIDVL